MSQSVGDQLKQARTSRGLTLDQAAQTTRIRRHYLEALERGNREDLPSPVQGRGFLRLYAGYLNLSAESLVAEWEGRPQLTPDPAPTPVPAPVRAGRAVAVPPPVEVEQSQPPEDTHIPIEQMPADLPEAGSANSIFAEIGQTLRHQREMLGLTLEEVEKHTRIHIHYLRALESGKVDQLPSTVQSRGMLSNFASFLNMDSDALMLRFAEALQMRRIERLPASPPPGLLAGRRATSKGAVKGVRTAQQARRLITPDLLFVGGLILALFLFIVWTAARVSSGRVNQVSATLPSVSDVLLYTVSPTAPPSPTGPAGVGSQNGTPGAASTPGSDSTSAPAGDSTATPALLIPPAITSTLGAINSDPVQIYIIARHRVFLRVTIDGSIKFNGRLVPGSAYPFSGKTSVDILTGDAAGIQIFYNQKDLGSLGDSGQPLDLTFTGKSMQTPTATVTPTATPTSRFSPTPSAVLTKSSPSPTPSVTPLIP